MDCSMPGLPVHHQLPELAQTHVHRIGDAIQPSHPLSSPSSLAFNLSQHQGLFSNESALCIRWPYYWSFSFIISPSSAHSGLNSQESSPTSQFKRFNSLALSFLYSPTSHPYMTTGKTIGLTRWTFVGKVMSLLLNMLPRLVITFLPRSKRLLISWLWSPSAVILEPRKIKSVICFHCFPIYLPWSDGTGSHVLSFLNVEL